MRFAKPAYSGLVAWPLAGLFVAGGVVGGLIGVRSAKMLADRRGLLNVVFAGIIICVGLYMLVHSLALS